jgi:hypothetical protein
VSFIRRRARVLGVDHALSFVRSDFSRKIPTEPAKSPQTLLLSFPKLSVVESLTPRLDVQPTASYCAIAKRRRFLLLLGNSRACSLPHQRQHLSGNVSIVPKRRTVAGSMIGGIPETQEMLDYCAEHGITSDVEVIRIQQINEAYERMIKGQVKYRFVIDIASLKTEG